MVSEGHESNRRQFLAASALCGVAGVAGCSGLLGGSDDLSVEVSEA
jgi:nitrous oxide reductase